MPYIAKYLPVDKPWTDGCMILDLAGNHSEWDASGYYAEDIKKSHKVAELFIVTYEFNEMKIIGQPSALAQKWVKPDMQFKHFNVIATNEKVYHGNFNVLDNEASGGYTSIVNVRCDVCNHLQE